MTAQQIQSLEWAVAQLLGSDAPEMVTLSDLLDNAKLEYAALYAKADFVGFMHKWGITVPVTEFANWRMLSVADQKRGEIQGLPESRGRVVCTNGILCYIERFNAFPFLGHLEFFVPDPTEQTTKVNPAKPAKAKKPTRDQAFELEFQP